MFGGRSAKKQVSARKQVSAKIPTLGSRAKVFHGKAKHTSGGLKKEDLMKNKNGKIVSIKAHSRGLVSINKLVQLGYVAQKGKWLPGKKMLVNGSTPLRRSARKQTKKN